MAEKEKISLTKAGKEQLEKELSHLVNEVRPQVIVELQVQKENEKKMFTEMKQIVCLCYLLYKMSLSDFYVRY